MSDETLMSKVRAYTSQFNERFWIVNTLELFERGAYYGTMAILAIHIVDNLDYSASTYGMMAALLMALLYFVPLIAAALAERIGYKKTLVGAFIFMILGYVSFSLFDGFTLLIVAILFLGIGAGAFKPMVSATIAHVTEEEHRNAGYSIYYWMINLGAFLIPLTIGLTKTVNLLDPEKDSHLVFMFSSVLITVNLLITLWKYEDPIEPNPDKDVFESLKKLATVVHDRNFIILLAIYSGFWYMFSMNHSFLPLYMKHFHIMPDWFSVFFLAIINPGTIIAVGFYLSKVVEKYDSLQLMMTGITLFIIGLLMLGLTTSPFFFFLGIMIFSIGEFITHPNFIAYVSKIAPKDKVAIYMGCVFIPTGVGYVLGQATGGFLFEIIAENAERPKLFWSIIACVGLFTLIGFVLYDNKIVKKGHGVGRDMVVDEGEDEDVVWEDEDGEVEKKEKDRKPSPIPFKLPPSLANSEWSPFIPAFIALAFIFVLPVLAYSAGHNTYYEDEDDDYYYSEMDWEDWESWSDYTNEGEESEIEEGFDEKGVARFEFTLIWNDEADRNTAPQDPTGRYENQPDEFNFTVVTPWGTYHSDTVENTHGQEGEIILEIEVSKDDVKRGETHKAETEGDFIIIVRCNNAGDQEYIGNDPTASDENDDGNDWELSARYRIWEKYEKGTGPGKI